MDSVGANPVVVMACEDDPVDFTLFRAEMLSKETDAREMARQIVELRNYLKSKGCYFPPLTDFLVNCRSEALKQGIKVEDAVFDTLYREFERYDDFDLRFVKHKHHSTDHKKREKKDIKVSAKMATGFLKFVGGSLLCLIPVPAIQGAGASLAVVGISDMVNAAREDSDAKEFERRLEENRKLAKP